MNTENFLKLRNFFVHLIKSGKTHKFDIGMWSNDSELSSEEFIHDCGTVACIGGWAEVIFNLERYGSEHHIADKLGLTTDTTDCMFYPPSYLWDSINIYTAISMLDHCMVSGIVDWQRAIENPFSLSE